MNNKSEFAVNFVDEIEKFSASKLNKKAELLRLYEEAINSGREILFEEVTFTAKYLRGLMRVMQAGTKNPEVTNMEQIKVDFSSNLEKLVDQLKEIITDSDDSLKEHFEKNFFILSQEGLINLNELLSDLEWAKMYLNAQKRDKKN